MIFDGFLSFECPVHLIDSEDDLTGPLDDPLGTWDFFEILLTGLDQVEQRGAHLALHFEQPQLHVALLVAFVHIHSLREINDFTLSTHHGLDLLLLGKHHGINAFEAFAHMRLHERWVFRLRQDLEQIVIRQEEEAGEALTLLTEVVI